MPRVALIARFGDETMAVPRGMRDRAESDEEEEEICCASAGATAAKALGLRYHSCSAEMVRAGRKGDARTSVTTSPTLPMRR